MNLLKLRHLIFLFPLSLVSCSQNTDSSDSLIIPIIDNGVSIHTDVQHAFLSGPNENINLYARGVEELSRPYKPTVSWEGSSEEYTIYLSTSSDYSDSLVYQTNESSYSFTNLQIATTYYYKVNDGSNTIKEDSFTTSSEPVRNMYVSGVTNVRDIGGYLVNNKRTNQGLIYRGARLNHNSVETVSNRINEKGINVMLNEMKIKSEIDLRGVSDNEVGGLTEGVGVLGEGVNYYQCPMSYTSDMTNEINIPSLQKVFSILGDKSNYPTYLHCSIGTDRTGYVAWLINAYFGIDEDNLWKDYLFSNFGNIDGKRNMDNIKNGYVKIINEYRGDSLREKTKNYLLDRGIKESELNVIDEMMLGR